MTVQPIIYARFVQAPKLLEPRNESFHFGGRRYLQGAFLGHVTSPLHHSAILR